MIFLLDLNSTWI